MKTKYKFRRINVRNRWNERFYKLNEGTIIGIDIWWCSPKDFAIKFCLFGFDVQIWIEREFIN